MKKIDLHIHTVPTVNDAQFEFNLEVLKKYVSTCELDAIAITNHNLFDAAQYVDIDKAFDILVLPGIEISLDCGHLLIIDDVNRIEDFEKKSEQIASQIKKPEDTTTIDYLIDVFGDLHKYLVIPHYLKKPSIKGNSLERMAEYISAGEVDSQKKFIRAHKYHTNITPVLFSDIRISNELDPFPTRQTFIDCGDLTFSALKTSLKDKNNVALSRNNGNSFFEILDSGLMIHTGLNVLLGERSSGKTFTLDKIFSAHENIKYIRQFSLVQKDDKACEKEFSKELKRTRSQFVEDYLSGLKSIINDIINVNLRSDNREVEKYISSLIASAEEADKRDAFSKTSLFDESEFSISEDRALKSLIPSVRHLIENVEYRETIDKHINIDSLKELAVELIEIAREKSLENQKKKLINSTVRSIKSILKRRTSAVQVQDIDLYNVCLNQKKADKFSEIVKDIQEKMIISEEQLQGFRVVATKQPYSGAGEIKTASGVVTSFKDAFIKYDEPFEYLQELLNNESLSRSDLYKLFVKIDYTILNRDGFEVSGGERSEFRLLQEINDAQNYDMLLIDEPESSFDNIFLRNDVNQIIKEISELMPVIVVTHNNTVGASICPNYILYAQKEFENGKIKYKIYSGYPTDQYLNALDGATISNHEITLNSLEAGCDTYENRRQRYEAIRNK
ncbi:phosphotransferase [Oceanidesulfovibrio indonesiensis]|uniref:Phosphotransferase n=1 Tax=Oceanidesulfovibrio indonesiensis TaxID=54767 RepID=A0A7M3MAJ4_9BACT|nr:phosphotransferase [Oceanidesulfovibrio indonesiensis]TVM14042.1 phosphotransferase [Oceanidesulfovibrio indonesiensis]